MGVFAGWTWQKAIGKLLPFAIAVGTAVFNLIEVEPTTWWVTIVAAATGVVQWLIATFPPKT